MCNLKSAAAKAVLEQGKDLKTFILMAGTSVIC